MKQYKRVYATVDLDAIRQNMEAMKANIAKGTMICGVVKSDGYGHGSVPVAKAVEDLVWGYAVAAVEEGWVLRDHHITKPILVLGYVPEEEFESLVEQEIRYTVSEWKEVEILSKIAQKLGKNAYVHIKMDTGMGRIGLRFAEEILTLAQKIETLPNIVIEGIFTHMATADMADKTKAKEQIRMFKEMLQLLENNGIYIPIRHCSNSAGIIDLKEANIDMVRAGIALYGLYPSEEVNKENVCLTPALELKSIVSYLKTVPKGSPIGYGATFVTQKETKVATVSIGYGDGYPRALSNKGYALVRGKKAPIIGRICMDQFMMDVSDIPEIQQGDTVTLIGKDQNEQITVEELAELAGTFNYEFVCDLGKRIPRVYISGGKIVGTKDYFHDQYMDFK
ncbi:MAG TPA: alanine racemase [Candidatus Fimimorpha faecalis]|uniref:Alanine racemase n=1 Tax=Candidatus Fimimorpha faecalis TaxID=2840824 RepID=A0A9D1EF17_9FIRM|nr:alanine racemase [Candidatus Fimimorpha faecalis]